MKVLLITNLFPNPSDPERGVFTLQLVKELNRKCELSVVCPLPWFPKFRFLKRFKKWYQMAEVPAQYEIDGITVYSPKYILIPKVSESIHSLFMAIGIRSFVKKIHVQIDFDVINSQWLYPDGVASEALAKNLNLPHVTTGLGCDINDDLYNDSKAPKILSMLNSVEGVTVVSSRLKDELIKHKIEPDKIKVILNGVDYDRFKYLDRQDCRNKLKLNADERIILYVGRLSDEKCVASLIEAFAKASKTEASLKLMLVGDGPEYDHLKKLVESLQLSDSVTFVGKVAHGDINQWFCAADIFCLPSKREGCPNVVLESLASGCPVVASDVGALPDLVSKDSGLLFKAEDVDDISSKLSLALSTKWDRSGIRQSMVKCTWSQAADAYIDAYRSAIKSSNRG